MHHFQIAGDSGCEAVPGLRFLLARQRYRAPAHFHAIRRSFGIQHRAANFKSDPAPQILQLRLELARQGLRFRHFAAHFAALENGNVQADRRRIGSMRAGRAPPDGAVIAVEVQRRQTPGVSRFSRQLRRLHAGGQTPVVQPRLISLLQRLFDRDWRRRLVSDLIGQADGLTVRQTDGPRQPQLLLLVVIAKSDQPLPLRLQLDLRPQNVDGRNRARLLEIDSLVVQRFRRRHLRFGRLDPAGRGDSLQIQAGHNQDQDFPRVPGLQLLGPAGPRAGFCLVDGSQVENGLRHLGANVEKAKRTHDRTNARE